MHIAVVAPLPPIRSGVATYAAEQIYWLAKEHEVTAYAAKPSETEPLPGCQIANLSELDDTNADVVLYHVGNSIQNLPQVRAAITGPPGVVELHDGSFHHLLEAVTLGAEQPDLYKDALAAAHGAPGAALAEVRISGSRGDIELALFDLLQPVLERHQRLIVHSRWAQLQARRRVAHIPSSIVPLHAPKTHPRLARELLGLSDDDLLIGHAGFVTSAKRPDCMVETLALVQEKLPKAKLVLLGSDQTSGALSEAIHRHNQADSVICTGYLSNAELHGFLAATDVVLALRAPHVGESSAPIAAAFAAGRPVVTQAIGAWAELPSDAVSFAPVTSNEALSLATELIEILSNPARQARLGAAARRIAQTEWAPEHCAKLVSEALRAAKEHPEKSPSWVPRGVAGRSAVVVSSPEMATELRMSGWQVASRNPDELAHLPTGTAGLLIWGDVDANLHSLAHANRCLDALGCFMWMNPPKRAGDALHRAGFTDGAGLPPMASNGEALIALKTRLPASPQRTQKL